MTRDHVSDGRSFALIGPPGGSDITEEQAERAARRVAEHWPDLPDDERRESIETVLQVLGLLPSDGPVLDSDPRFHGWSPTRLSAVRDPSPP